MEFAFRMANEKDIPVICEMARQAKDKVPDPDWFEADEEEFFLRHISEEGFTILAFPETDGDETSDGIIAAYLIIRFPGKSEDNLGEYLKLSEEEMLQVAHFESTVVLPEYRGNSIQYNLFLEAEKILEKGWKGKQICRLMATVHPDNIFSFGNMERIGMKIAADVVKYGGKRRYVMWKENKSNNEIA